MKSFQQTTIRLLVALTLSLSLALGASPIANAASLKVSGTVNCNGSTTTYTKVRSTGSAYRKVEIHVTDFTKYHWTSWGVKQNVTGTHLSALIVKSGRTTTSRLATPVTPWATIMGADYVAQTRFRIRASMVTHHRGTCDSSWGGTLHY